MHLKDLIAIHTALPDLVEGAPGQKLINLRKMCQLYSVLSTVTRLQDCSLPFSVNVDLIDTLKLAFDVFYSEEEIFELSLAREPRPNGTPSSPVSLISGCLATVYHQLALYLPRDTVLYSALSLACGVACR